ncbi:MAG: tetratricopeptide repeat protein, partial [Saprospiraceae bacterium]
AVLYRPVSLVMFAIEWELSPDNPHIHHFGNIFLYGLTGLLLCLTLIKLFNQRNPILAVLSTLFFLAHPVHTEVVANIKSRDEMLLFFFAIAAFYSLWKYLETNRKAWMFGSLLAYTLAIFSKLYGVTMLLVFPLLLYFFRTMNWSRMAKLSSLYLIPTAIFLAIRFQVLGGWLGGGAKVSILDNFLVGAPNLSLKLASTFMMLGKYLLTLIFPWQLHSDLGYHQIPISSWGNGLVLLGLVSVAGLAYFAIRQFAAKSIWSFCILFSGISFSVYTNLVFTIGTAYGERFLYVASLGFSMALAYGILKLFKVDLDQKLVGFSQFVKQHQMPLLLSLVILLCYSFKTLQRNQAWKSSYDLYATDIKTAPNCAKLNYHLGLEQVKKGLDSKEAKAKQAWFDAAFQQFEKAIAIYPDYHDAYGQLGLAYYRKNDFGNAMRNYQKSIALKPNNAKVFSNMGIIYFNQGQLPKAEEVYKKAVALDPRFLDARRNLGSVFAETKRFDQAIEQFQAALALAPNDATINYYLGRCYSDKGDQQTGQGYLNKAYQLNPALKKN